MLHLFGVFKSDLLKVRSITVDSLLYEHLYNKSHYKVDFPVIKCWSSLYNRIWYNSNPPIPSRILQQQESTVSELNQ